MRGLRRVRRRYQCVVAAGFEVADRVLGVAHQVSCRERERCSHRYQAAALLRRGLRKEALGGVQLADLPDPSRQGREEQDGGRYGEEEEAQEVGQVVDALLARSARVGDLAAGSRAGVAQRISHFAADHRQAGDGVRCRSEAVLYGLSAVAHACAEDGQVVHGVVDLQREPGEHEERQQRERVPRDRSAALVRCVGIDPHMGRIPLDAAGESSSPVGCRSSGASARAAPGAPGRGGGRRSRRPRRRSTPS